SVNEGILQNDGTITDSLITAYAGATFINNGTVGDPIADGGVVDNYGTAGFGIATNGGTFNNKDGAEITGDASAENGGTFNNDGDIVGNATVTGDNSTFNNNGFGWIDGNATVSGDNSTFNNDGKIFWDATISGTGSEFNNAGDIDGDVLQTDGTFNQNSGDISGTAYVSDGVFNANG